MRDLFVGTLVFCFFLGTAQAQPQIVSAFDSNLEGWTSNNTPAEWRARTGGGYLYVDNNEIGVAAVSAPAKFHGNLSAYEGGTLSFDGNLFEALDRYWAEGEGMNYGTVTISGPGGTVTKDLVAGQPPTNQWIGYELLLIHDTFGIERPQWLAILSNVTSITVNIEAIYGREKNGFDNFSIKGATDKLTVLPRTAYLFMRKGQTGQALPRTVVHIQSGVKFQITGVAASVPGKVDSLVWTTGSQFTHILDLKPFPGLAEGRHNITLQVSVPGRPVTNVEVIIDVGGPDEVSLNGLDGPGFLNSDKPRFTCGPANVAVAALNGGAQITQRPDPPVPGCEKRIAIDPDPFASLRYKLGIGPSAVEKVTVVASRRSMIEAPPSVLFDDSKPVEKTIRVTNTSNRDVLVNTSVAGVNTGNAFSVVGSGAFLIPANSTIELPVKFDPTGLDKGYYTAALLLLEGTQQVDRIILAGEVSGAAPSLRSDRYGLLFVPNNGVQPPPQKLRITNIRATQLNFGTQVAHSPDGGGFQVAPLQGTIPAGGSIELTVTPPAIGSAPARTAIGIYDTGNPEEDILWMTAIGSYYAGGKQLTSRNQSACTPSELFAVFTRPAMASSVETGQTVAIGVEIKNNCGAALETGQVSVEFDNGDAAVELYHAGEGQWDGVWRPRSAEHGSVTLKVLAFSADGNQFGFETVTLDIGAGSNPPPLFEARSITNAASQRPNMPLAPAEIISIYGEALAASEAHAATLPLPTTLGGASVTLQGEPLPLLYAGPSQINAIVPRGLPEGEPLSLMVRRGDSLSFPAQMVLTTAVPGVFTPNQSGTGQGIITDVNYQILNAQNPAAARDPIILFLAGLGAVDPPKSAGEGGAGAEPLNRVQADFSVTIGGLQAEVLYAVLAPNFAGLYQAAVKVPVGVSPGNAVPVIVTADGISGPPVTIAVQ